MKRQIIVEVLVSFAGIGIAMAQTPYPAPYPPPAPYGAYPAPVPPPPPPPAPYPVPYPFFFPPDAGPYALLEVGPSFYQNGQLTTFGTGTSATVHYDTGVTFDMNLGYAFNKYVAVGFETGINSTTINSISGGYYISNGDLYNVPFMGTVTFTYPIAHTRLIPYIGGGLGGSDSVFDPSQLTYGNTTVSGEEDEVVFAWEAYAGLRYQLTPNMSVGIGYKYFGTDSPNFSYPPYNNSGPNFNVAFDGIQSHSVMFSFNWRF